MKRIFDEMTRHEHITSSPLSYPLTCTPSLSSSSSSPSPSSSPSYANMIPLPSPTTPSAPRFSFLTMANKIPLPWSRTAAKQQVESFPKPGTPQVVYVSKETQLAKLQSRLTREQARSLTRNGVDVCKKCENAAVHL
jgi:hypothetical protein